MTTTTNHKELKPLVIDLDCRATLRKAKLSLNSVLPKGRELVVKTATNESAARECESIRDQVHDDVVCEGARAAEVLGVRLAGLDVISPDIRVPLRQNGGAIIEVNTSPGLHYHYQVGNVEQRVPVAVAVLGGEQTRHAKIVHVDFHCDMRELLIDRKKQLAYRIRDRYAPLNEGNFLTHAILERIVHEIRWVHDEPGGRNDDLKIVKYQSDMSAQAHRLGLALRRVQGIPVRFEVMTSGQWDGIRPGEVLDIDWDYFACLDYAVNSIPKRVDAFLSRDFANLPNQTFICHSPEYCHPTKQQFNSFVEELAKKFAADVIQVPNPKNLDSSSAFKTILGPIYHPVRNIYRHPSLS